MSWSPSSSWRSCALAIVCGLACASEPPPPAAGTGSVWGQLTLVPREGVEPSTSAAGYGDRRLRHAKLVDYRSAGFAVVFLESELNPATAPRLTIQQTSAGLRLQPSQLATATGSQLVIHNATTGAQTVSCPELGVLKPVPPGEDARVDLEDSGSDTCFLLEQSSGAATVFVAPGRFAVVSKTGRFVLTDLPPGTHQLRAWHPRFPPVARTVVIRPDRSLRLDLEMGVGRAGATR